MIPSGRFVALLVFPLSLGMLALVFPGTIFAMVALDVVIFLVALLDWLVTRGDLEIQRDVHSVQSVARPFPVRLRVSNPGVRPLRILLVDDAPGKSDVFPLTLTIPAGQMVEQEYSLEVGRRGHKEFGPVTVRWSSPLGLWRQQRRYEVASTLRVYPSFHQLRSWGLKARQAEQNVPVRARRRPGGENEFQVVV